MNPTPDPIESVSVSSEQAKRYAPLDGHVLRSPAVEAILHRYETDNAFTFDDMIDALLTSESVQPLAATCRVRIAMNTESGPSSYLCGRPTPCSHHYTATACCTEPRLFSTDNGGHQCATCGTRQPLFPQEP